MPIKYTDYLRDLATRLRKVPVCHGVDGHDIDTLREVSMGIAELEKANVAYVEANTGLIAELAAKDAEIAKLQSDRNLFKGKYRALLKLVSRTRDKLVHVTDHIEDEGDRRYFGSTNDADELVSLFHTMESWIWDAVDETNRMKSDPYADIREQRARAEKAEGAIEKLADKIEDLIAEFGDDPKAALECVSEHLQLRRHGKPEVPNARR